MIQKSSCANICASDAEIALIANHMRHDIIEMLAASGSGHPGGSLSAAEILATLYFSGVMAWDPTDANNPRRDRFILSKGHIAPALYAVLSQVGYLSHEELATLRKFGSRLQGHPDSNLCPGVEVGTGSLGQGLSIAAGMALGLRMNAQATGEMPRRVFVLTGDGELQEGQNWEAAMFAAHTYLSNLTLLVDNNNLQIDGHVSEVNDIEPLADKFRAFGWHVFMADGHDVPSLHRALSSALESGNAPSVIIAKTIKGKGVSFMENKASWHGSAPTPDEAAQALSEIDAAGKLLAAAVKGA